MKREVPVTVWLLFCQMPNKNINKFVLLIPAGMQTKFRTPDLSDHANFVQWSMSCRWVAYNPNMDNPYCHIYRLWKKSWRKVSISPVLNFTLNWKFAQIKGFSLGITFSNLAGGTCTNNDANCVLHSVPCCSKDHFSIIEADTSFVNSTLHFSCPVRLVLLNVKLFVSRLELLGDGRVFWSLVRGD